jgi:hypothetical protein
MKKTRKKRRNYFEPGLIPQGYEQESNDDDIVEFIEEGIATRRDYDVQRSAAKKVYVTDLAPYDIKEKAIDRNAWLTSEQPLRINFEGSDEEYEVEADWIVLESIGKITDSVINKYLGKSIVEYGGGGSYAVKAYDENHYNDPKDAYREFSKLNKNVGKHKQTNLQTVKQFLKNVYRGGDHTINMKEFLATLKQKGIIINNRREAVLTK